MEERERERAESARIARAKKRKNEVVARRTADGGGQGCPPQPQP